MHLLRHTAAKSEKDKYFCLKCNDGNPDNLVTFTSQEALRIHSREVHREDVKCPHCDFTIAPTRRQESLMDEHIR